MPIRPEHRHLYPPDWPELARELKAAAGWRCVCVGECGRAHDGDDGRCPERHGEAATWRRQSELVARRAPRVVLTVGHRNHIPDDCSPGNLAVWCQACHLAHDRAEHARRRRATWAARRRARELAQHQAPRQLAIVPDAPPPPGLAAAKREARETQAATAAMYAAEKRGQARFLFSWRQQ